MSNCDRLSDDAAFVDCLTLAPFDAWTARDALRLLTIAVRATHLPAQRYVSSQVWTPVSERLPERGRKVLVAVRRNGETHYIHAYHDQEFVGGFYRITEGGGQAWAGTVTHWTGALTAPTCEPQPSTKGDSNA
jgi:hypothetical protein